MVTARRDDRIRAAGNTGPPKCVATCERPYTAPCVASPATSLTCHGLCNDQATLLTYHVNPVEVTDTCLGYVGRPLCSPARAGAARMLQRAGARISYCFSGRPATPTRTAQP